METLPQTDPQTCRLCLQPGSVTNPLELVGRWLACLDCADLVRPVPEDSSVRERAREARHGDD